MKIVKVYTLKNRGPYAASEHWETTRKQIHDAIRGCEWPVGSGSFTIYPESGKERGKGNGVKPIRDRFVRSLKAIGWRIDRKEKKALDERLGDLDAVLQGPNKPIVVEWETGDVYSPHLSINRMELLLKTQAISAGVLVVPAQELSMRLPDQMVYVDEIEPYVALWQSVRCREAVLEVAVIEQDTAGKVCPRLPIGVRGLGSE